MNEMVENSFQKGHKAINKIQETIHTQNFHITPQNNVQKSTVNLHDSCKSTLNDTKSTKRNFIFIQWDELG